MQIPRIAFVALDRVAGMASVLSSQLLGESELIVLVNF